MLQQTENVQIGGSPSDVGWRNLQQAPHAPMRRRCVSKVTSDARWDMAQNTFVVVIVVMDTDTHAFKVVNTKSSATTFYT